MRIVLALLTLLLGLSGAVPAEARTMTLGFAGVRFEGVDDPWLTRAVGAGTQLTMFSMPWRQTAPTTRPEGFDERDPADPAYRFETIDAQVRAAAAGGFQAGLTIAHAPDWAVGPRPSKSAAPGTWRPVPSRLGAFAEAVARRYSGTFADPLRPGQTLPRVRVFQVWSEPNLRSHLAPQWNGRRPAAPGHYRRLLNAFYASVKAVQPDALVVTAGTAPFGEGAGGNRMQPARFWREVLCLRGRSLKLERCPQPARFDALAHHPYSVGKPGRRALNADDVSVPDLRKLTRPLRRAVATGRALPRRAKRLWVTEFSYDSSPPDPQGVPMARHARWVAESLYRFDRQGVDTVTWFRLGDQPGPQWDATYQSGMYFVDGRAKPSLRAFRFPVFAHKRGKRHYLWARSPVAGTLRVERSSGKTWRTVATRSLRAGQTADVRVPTGRGSLRAVVGDLVSMAARP